MPSRVRLIALDLDKVLWDHHDVTSLTLPLRRVDEMTLVDSKGERVVLREGVREFLQEVRARGIYLSTCSWNDPEKALAVLRAFDLERYFDYIMIEPHPDKGRMMKGILNRFPWIEENEVVFVDDREDMLERVRMRYPEIRTIRFHPEGDVFSFSQLSKILLGG